jgi:hypothetical protein
MASLHLLLTTPDIPERLDELVRWTLFQAVCQKCRFVYADPSGRLLSNRSGNVMSSNLKMKLNCVPRHRTRKSSNYKSNQNNNFMYLHVTRRRCTTRMLLHEQKPCDLSVSINLAQRTRLYQGVPTQFLGP